jgi:hypothetical protein
MFYVLSFLFEISLPVYSQCCIDKAVATAIPMHKIIALTMATVVDVAKAQRCIEESRVDIYGLTRQQKKFF